MGNQKLFGFSWVSWSKYFTVCWAFVSPVLLGVSNTWFFYLFICQTGSSLSLFMPFCRQYILSFLNFSPQQLIHIFKYHRYHMEITCILVGQVHLACLWQQLLFLVSLDSTFICFDLICVILVTGFNAWLIYLIEIVKFSHFASYAIKSNENNSKGYKLSLVKMPNQIKTNQLKSNYGKN